MGSNFSERRSAAIRIRDLPMPRHAHTALKRCEGLRRKEKYSINAGVHATERAQRSGGKREESAAREKRHADSDIRQINRLAHS